MSDRVLMRGAAVAAGGIPWQACLAEVTEANSLWIYQNAVAAEVGSSTSYPVGMTLDQMMELYWRFRKLRVIADVSSSYGGTVPPTEHSGTYNGSVEREVNRPSGTETVTREGLLVLPAPFLMSEVAGDLQLIVNIFGRPGFPIHAVKYHGGMYYPMIEVDAGLNGVSVHSYGGSFPMNDVFCTLAMSGVTSFNIPMATDSPLHYFGGNIAIDAEEYWPHKKADGNPKFDTNTGARL